MSEIVRALSYEVLWAPDADYERAPAVLCETDDFAFELSGRQLRVTAKREYSSVEDAREQVSTFLRGWEVTIGLLHGPGSVRFRFERAEVDEYTIDPSSGIRAREAKFLIETSADMRAAGDLSHGRYPSPMQEFIATNLVEILYLRYSRYTKREEPLLSMAGFCLTALEASCTDGEKGRRQRAAEHYNIAITVLNRLGELTATRGDSAEARKAPHGLGFASLTAAERRWVVDAVKSIIRRSGEAAACPGRHLPPITMEDLPDLESHP